MRHVADANMEPKIPPQAAVNVLNFLLRMLDGLRRRLNPAPLQIIETVDAYKIAQAVHVVTRLGVADQLRDKALEINDLARRCQADPDALYRVLRTLAGKGIFKELTGRRFALTASADFLRPDKPGSLWAWVMLLEESWPVWQQMVDTVRTGKPGFEKVHGAGVFEYHRQNPAAGRIYDTAMAQLSRYMAQTVAAQFDFSKINIVVDVGGGNGTLLAGLLRKFPNLRGVLFDLPDVVPGATEVMSSFGLASRCDIVGGSFFDTVPAGADMYLLKNVLHDWNDQEAARILGNCFRAMAPHSKLVILESVIPAGNRPSSGKIIDLTMLVATGGRERTKQEFADLLERAGFNMRKVRRTPFPNSIIEAERKPGAVTVNSQMETPEAATAE